MKNTPARAASLLLTACLALCGAQSHAQDCVLKEPTAVTEKARALAKEAAKSNPCVTVPGMTAKSLASVWSAFTTKTKTGGKRFDTEPPEGTPTGRVLVGKDGLTFDLSAVAGEGLMSLQVSSQGAVLTSLAAPLPAVVTVPAARLKGGDVHEWVLQTRKTQYRGQFEVLDAQETAAVRQRLAALSNSELSPQLKLLYVAAIYDDADLFNERNRVLGQLRDATQP